MDKAMTKMQTAASEAIQNLRVSQTQSEINDAMARMASLIGAQYFQIIPVCRNNENEIDTFLSFGNYPDTLNSNYSKQTDVIQDPCINVAMRNNCVILWRKVFSEAKAMSERDFINKIRKIGIKDGLTLPIYGPEGCMAVLNFASCDFIDLCDGDDELLLLCAVMAYQKIRQCLIRELNRNKKTVQLSDREIECLNWVIEGKTNWEIGVLMGISPRTVQFHIANCQMKLGGANRIQTVVKAVVNNIIRPRKDDDIIYINETKGFDAKDFAAKIGIDKFKNALYDCADEVFEMDMPGLIAANMH